MTTMALGDQSTGIVTDLTRADSFRCRFQSGARAGESWTVRILLTDAIETEGFQKFAGQSARAFVANWLPPPRWQIEITERGTDQWGRLAAGVSRPGDPVRLGVALVNAGLAVEMFLAPFTPPGTERWVRVQIAPGIPTPPSIEIDQTKP